MMKNDVEKEVLQMEHEPTVDGSANYEVDGFTHEAKIRQSKDSIRLVRFGVFLAFMLHTTYGLFDHIFIEGSLEIVRLCRYLWLMPSLIVLLLLTFNHTFTTYVNYYVGIPLVSHAIVFAYWTYLDGQNGVEYCYPAIIMVVAFCYFSLGLRFVVATVYSWFSVFCFLFSGCSHFRIFARKSALRDGITSYFASYIYIIFNYSWWV